MMQISRLSTYAEKKVDQEGGCGVNKPMYDIDNNPDESCVNEESEDEPPTHLNKHERECPDIHLVDKPKLYIVSTNKKDNNYNNSDMKKPYTKKKFDIYLFVLRVMTAVFIQKKTMIPMFQYINEENIRNDVYASESRNIRHDQYKYIEYCYESVDAEHRAKYTWITIKDLFRTGFRYNPGGMLGLMRNVLGGSRGR